MNDPSLLTTEDLLKEIATRFETAVFIGQKEADPVGSDERVNAWRYKGNRWTCIGLANNVIHILNKQLDEDTEKLPPGNL